MSDYSGMTIKQLMTALENNPVSVSSPLIKLKDQAGAIYSVLDKAYGKGIISDTPFTGAASDLETTDKDTLVSAINELYNKIKIYLPTVGVIYPNMQNGLSTQHSILSSNNGPVPLYDGKPVTLTINTKYSSLADNQGIGLAFTIQKQLKDGTIIGLPLAYSTNTSDISAGNKFLTDNKIPIVLRKSQNAIGSTYSVVFSGLMEGLGISGGTNQVKVPPRVNITIKDDTTLVFDGSRGEDFTNNTDSSNTNGAYYTIAINDIWLYEISSTAIVPLANGTVIGNFSSGDWPCLNYAGNTSFSMSSVMTGGNWAYCGSGIIITTDKNYWLSNGGITNNFSYNPSLSLFGIVSTDSGSRNSLKIPISCLYSGFTLKNNQGTTFSISGNSIVLPKDYNYGYYKGPLLLGINGGTATITTYI